MAFVIIGVILLVFNRAGTVYTKKDLPPVTLSQAQLALTTNRQLLGRWIRQAYADGTDVTGLDPVTGAVTRRFATLLAEQVAAVRSYFALLEAKRLHAVTEQTLLRGQAEHPGRGAGGDDDRAGAVLSSLSQ